MKKGVSVIVSYILIILLAVSMAGMIYGFLQYRAAYREKIECPKDVSLYVEYYECQDNNINITLKNNGFWNVSGVNIKAYYKGTIINVTNIDGEIGIGDSKDFVISKSGGVDKIEILPFIKVKNRIIFCSDAVFYYDVSC